VFESVDAEKGELPVPPMEQRETDIPDLYEAVDTSADKQAPSGIACPECGGALWERVRYDGTAQRTRRRSEYRVPRFRDLPDMDVQVIDRREVEPAGAGESPITLTAPAVAAAIFDATSERRRALPLLAARR
jgi:isoquinoline 1-oxidoreductase